MSRSHCRGSLTGGNELCWRTLQVQCCRLHVIVKSWQVWTQKRRVVSLHKQFANMALMTQFPYIHGIALACCAPNDGFSYTCKTLQASIQIGLRTQTVLTSTFMLLIIARNVMPKQLVSQAVG